MKLQVEPDLDHGIGTRGPCSSPASRAQLPAPHLYRSSFFSFARETAWASSANVTVTAPGNRDSRSSPIVLWSGTGSAARGTTRKFRWEIESGSYSACVRAVWTQKT